MTIQKFIIKGECVPKGRPRFNGRTRRTYTPKKTRDYERHVYYELKSQGAKQISGGVIVDLTVIKQPPKSWSKLKQSRAENKLVLATARPDLDNYLKSVLDGARELIFKDDSYVVEVSMRKEYGKDPCAILEVREARGEPAYD